ncbi:MAG: serine--tRNA ligase [Candidatus Falkowbacteria bacterium]
MLDIKFIRENKEEVKENCKNRLAKVDVDELLKLDKKRRELETKIGELRSKRNTGSKEKPSPDQIEEMKKIGEEIKNLEENLKNIEPNFRELWLAVPNLTHPDVRVSDNEDDNPVLDTFGEPTKFNFKPKDHVELANINDLIDFERATKISGAKFYYLKNELALMEFALIQYALDIARKHNFTPFITPDLAKQEVLEGLGFNPRGESTQVYNIENSDLSLIGTAEITMGGYHMNEVLDESELPKKYVAVSHCFRTETGSYSKFSKGIFRVHQFTKIEMFQYVMPEKAEKAHQEILKIEREIFEGLAIPFRVIDHCTADLGGPAIRTYDLEAWMPGKAKSRLATTNGDHANKNNEESGDWAEITSTSNCTDYQARGLNIKYKDKNGKKDYLYMLNGTAIAVTRAIIAIMENNQQEDGSIVIPEILIKYMNGIEIINQKK